MNVLANLKALLSPKAGAGTAQPTVGQLDGALDFAALLGGSSAIATTPVLPSVMKAEPDVLGIAPLPGQAESDGYAPLTLPNLVAAGTTEIVAPPAPPESPVGLAVPTKVENGTSATPDAPVMTPGQNPEGPPTPARTLPAQVSPVMKMLRSISVSIPAALDGQTDDEAPVSADSTGEEADGTAATDGMTAPVFAPLPLPDARPEAAAVPGPPQSLPIISGPIISGPIVSGPIVSGNAGATVPAAAAAPIAPPTVAAVSTAPVTLAAGAIERRGRKPAPVVASGTKSPESAPGTRPLGTQAPAILEPATSPAPPSIGEATALLRLASGGVPIPGNGPVKAEPESAPDGIAPASPRPYSVPEQSVAPVYNAAPATPAAHVADMASNPAPISADVQPRDVQPAAGTAPAATVPVPAPVMASSFDLSTSLGQRVIDMSVGGQWIDGLAKEIATLASGTGQGTFHLSPPHLGPMRVEIRNGDLGAQVSLTVQTEAAETALRQDGDRLKADGQLSALRISDVRVERVHQVAEPSRSDAATGQNANGNGSGNQGSQAALAQGQGQNQAQGQAQANGQQAGRKASPGEAVLGHAEPASPRVDDDMQSGLRRARYA